MGGEFDGSGYHADIILDEMNIITIPWNWRYPWNKGSSYVNILFECNLESKI